MFSFAYNYYDSPFCCTVDVKQKETEHSFFVIRSAASWSISIWAQCCKTETQDVVAELQGLFISVLTTLLFDEPVTQVALLCLI